jgi:shikimate kinase
MGSGKTTVGRDLASLLDWQFVDLDAEIVARKARPVADIFRSEGESSFRQIETEVLRDVLRTAAPAVIALGGGTFIQPANRELLRSQAALVAHLDGEFELVKARCCTEEGVRPLMQDAAQFRKLFEQRRPIYRSAEIIVDIAGKTSREIAAEILAQVETWKSYHRVPD